MCSVAVLVSGSSISPTSAVVNQFFHLYRLDKHRIDQDSQTACKSFKIKGGNSAQYFAPQYATIRYLSHLAEKTDEVEIMGS